MQLDVVDLRTFYAAPLGMVARRLLGRAIRQRWSSTTGLCVAGLGFATPYLEIFAGEAERVLALMPAEQGVVNWPSDGLSARRWRAHMIPSRMLRSIGSCSCTRWRRARARATC